MKTPYIEVAFTIRVPEAVLIEEGTKFEDVESQFQEMRAEMLKDPNAPKGCEIEMHVIRINK